MKEKIKEEEIPRESNEKPIAMLKRRFRKIHISTSDERKRKEITGQKQNHETTQL